MSLMSLFRPNRSTCCHCGATIPPKPPLTEAQRKEKEVWDAISALWDVERWSKRSLSPGGLDVRETDRSWVPLRVWQANRACELHSRLSPGHYWTSTFYICNGVLKIIADPALKAEMYRQQDGKYLHPHLIEFSKKYPNLDSTIPVIAQQSDDPTTGPINMEEPPCR